MGTMWLRAGKSQAGKDPLQVADKRDRFGIKLTRKGPEGTTRYNPVNFD